MPRRRPESLPADRLAIILGIPSAASPGVAAPPHSGWVPRRASVASQKPAVPDIVAPDPAVPDREMPDPVVPDQAVSKPALAKPTLRDPAVPKHAVSKPAILTVPMSLRGFRARPRRLAVLGVLVLLVAVAVVLGIRVAWARSSARPATIAAAAHGPPGGLVSRTVPPAFAPSGPTGSPSSAGVVLVHVVGQVPRPGVVRLPPGSRVLNAVNAAGGAMRSADLNHLNLARVVADGEQIVVPKPGEIVPVAGAPGSPGAGAGSSGQGSTGAGSAGGLVDLNTADAAALDSLPGVGPVLSQRILDWRTEHGRFSSVDELGEVSGIGDKLLAQIGPKVRV